VGPRRRARPVGWADRHGRLLLIAPALLVVAAVVLYPLGYSIWASFVDEISFPDHHWAGLANYRNVVEDSAAQAALAHTAILCGAAVALELVIGLLLALSVSTGRAWRRMLIPLLVLPMFASSVTAGQFWHLLLDPTYGPVDFLLGKFVGHQVAIDWSARTTWTYAGIVLADAWQWTPLVFLILFAGLRLIPSELYEAAAIDGATAWQSFRSITAPLLAPVVLLALTLRLVDATKLFDVPFVFSGGQPTSAETASLYLYHQGFVDFFYSFAAAGSWLFVLVVAAAAISLSYPLLRRGAFAR
jgi:multiple sugar transport system permease protein